jgi:ABC-type branched-subunit amino acid transport system permease subunit
VGTGLVMYLQNVISGMTEAWRLIEGLVFVAIVVFLPGGLLGAFHPRGPGRARLLAAVRARGGAETAK